MRVYAIHGQKWWIFALASLLMTARAGTDVWVNVFHCTHYSIHVCTLTDPYLLTQSTKLAERYIC